MTVLDLIKSSLRQLRVIGAAEAPTAADSSEALSVLNMMIGQWNAEGMMVYRKLNETFSAVANTGTYTIGASQTWNTTRPIKIESAFARDSSNTDYRLNILTNNEYQKIADKSDTMSVPTDLFYLPAYPTGTVYLWPIPTQNMTIGITQLKQLTEFASLTETISLPPGYESALRYNLAIELAPIYKSTIDQIIYDKAASTKANLMRVNAEVPEMEIDSAAMGDGFGGYDIESDLFL